MTIRLIILVFATLLCLVVSLTSVAMDGFGITWFFGACTLVGIYAIIRVLQKHTGFKLTGDILTIESETEGIRTIDLNTVSHWQTFGFHIRGQKQMTIALIFEKKEKVFVENSDHESEFAALLTYLKQNHAGKKQKPFSSTEWHFPHS